MFVATSDWAISNVWQELTIEDKNKLLACLIDSQPSAATLPFQNVNKLCFACKRVIYAAKARQLPKLERHCNERETPA